MKKKSVVLLAPTPPPIGGIAQWTVRMMNATLKHGWKVEVVDEKIVGKREVFGDKVKHNIKDEAIRCFNIWNGLRKCLKRQDTLIVHSCIPANTMPVIRECICAVITKLKHRKFIVHFRCTVPNMVTSSLNRIAVKMLCNLSDCVMVLNHQSKDYIKTLSKTSVKIIPNFVETNELQHSHVINKDVKRVLYVGGVIEAKGCIDLIEVAKAFPDIEFRFVGNPEAIVKKAASKVKNVVLLGEKDRAGVNEELENADIFAFLSYFKGEGFSNALAEAMAEGLPCLVTDWAANKDMIEDQGGEVVPIRSPQEAANAIKKMLPMEVRQQQSEFNRNKIKTAYASDIVLDQYVDCYESLLRKKR